MIDAYKDDLNNLKSSRQKEKDLNLEIMRIKIDQERGREKLFEKAMEYEKLVSTTGNPYTWVAGHSLAELLENKDDIIEFANLRREKAREKDARTWQQRLAEDDSDDGQGCLICSL